MNRLGKLASGQAARQQNISLDMKLLQKESERAWVSCHTDHVGSVKLAYEKSAPNGTLSLFYNMLAGINPEL